MEWKEIMDFVDKPFLHMGQTAVSLASLFQLGLVFALSYLAARLIRTGLQSKVLRRTQLDPGQQFAMARIAGYVVMLLGLLIGMPLVGFDMSSLTVLLGALGVGIGFGMQNIVNNFVSGLIILFERPIQIGHRVEVAGTMGRVAQIGARSTTVITNDNIAMVIPNSKFIEETVVNWNFRDDRRVRFKIPVGVSYNSDPVHVKRLLLQVATDNKEVLSDPSPNVVFIAFGESSLDFELRVWTDTSFDHPSNFRSILYFAIWELFKANGIEIPFPQRDVHIKGPPQPAVPVR